MMIQGFLCERRPVVAMASATITKKKEHDLKQLVGDSVQSAKSFVHQVIDVFNDTRSELMQSTVARLVTIAVLFPLDSAKTRVQVSSRTTRAAVTAITGSNFGGMTAALLGHLPHGALAFSLFTVIQSRLLIHHSNHNNNNNGRNRNKSSNNKISNRVRTIGAACIADTLASIWLAPAELIKVRVQSGMTDSIKTAVSNGKLLNGISTQILRDVPFRVFYLIAFNNLRESLNKKNNKPFSKVENIGMAAIVGAGISAVTTPFDVVRSRIMAQHPESGKVYANWLHCFSRTVRQEGVGALYRGIIPRSVYMAASIAVFIFTYDRVKEFSDKRSETKVARMARNK